jgi:hypothetical protein
MEKTKAWSALGGTTPIEKLGSLGVFEGRILDVRFLDEIARTYGVSVMLFFEEDLARTRTLESVQQEFAPGGNLSGRILPSVVSLRLPGRTIPRLNRPCANFLSWSKS